MYGYGYQYVNSLVIGSGEAPFPNQYSLDFDGVNDRLLVGDNTSLNFVHETGIFTMSYWIKLTDYTIASPIRISGNNGTSSARNGFEFDYNQIVGERRLRLRITVNPIAVILSETTINAITDNDWHNVIIQGNGTNVFFTIDGVTQTGSGTMSGLGAGDADYPLSIGSVNGYTPNPMNGNLDEVSLFNTNSIDTSTIYNSGNPTDLTALNPLAWLRNGDPTAEYKSPQWLIPNNENKDKISNYSMKFSGGGQIVGIGTALDLGTDSTVSFWVKRDAVAVNEVWLGEDTYTSDYFIFMTSTREFYVKAGAAYVGWISTEVKNIFNNTTDWVSVIIVRSGNTMELFLNGDSMNVFGMVTSGTPGATVTRFDTIGAKPGLGNSTKAKFAEVAAWSTDTVLPADIYNLGVLPDLSIVSPAPVSYWKMGDNATYSGGVWTVPDEVGAKDGTSVNMVIGDRIGDTPDSTLNAVTINMEEVDRELDTP